MSKVYHELPTPVYPFTHYTIDENGAPKFVSISEFEKLDFPFPAELCEALSACQKSGQYVVAVFHLTGGKIVYNQTIDGMPITEYDTCAAIIRKQLVPSGSPKIHNPEPEDEGN
jgi:hypothetical protein